MAVLSLIALHCPLTTVVHAADPGIEFGAADDLSVMGVQGNEADPDVEIKGFTVFGATQAVYTGAAAGAGNVVVNGYLSVSSGAYFAADSTFTAISVGSITTAGAGVIFSTNAYFMNGSVGIGTANPGGLLHVRGVGGAVPVIVAESTSGDARLKLDTPTGSWMVTQQAPTDKLFISDAEDSRDVMVFDGDGNVGIGTAAPGSKLTVNGSIQVGQDTGEADVVIFRPTSRQLSFLSGPAHATNLGIMLNIGAADDTDSTLNFYGEIAGYNGAAQTYLIEDSGNSYFNGGNVGIGTTAPAAKLAINGGLHVGGDSDPGDNNLKVDGNAETSGNVVVGNGAGSPEIKLNALAVSGIGSIKLYNAGLDRGFGLEAVPDQDHGADLHFYNKPGYAGASRLVTIKRAGNVGIGTTAPGEKLEVNGNIKAAGLQIPGTIVNVVTVQTRDQSTFAAPTSGDGTAITPLNLVITPKKAGNKVILEWVVNGEIVNNAIYIVTRNDVKLADTTNASNNRWAGITTALYDADNSSTPDNAVVKIIDMNTLDVETTYKLQIRASGATAYTLYLNRTITSAGADDYEAGLSVGTAMEIWQ